LKYADEVGSGTMIYIPSFIKIGSGVQNVVEVNSPTHRCLDDLISLLLFFKKYTEGWLKMICTFHALTQFSVYLTIFEITNQKLTHARIVTLFVHSLSYQIIRVVFATTFPNSCGVIEWLILIL
jgi:hypothetical protein